MISRLLHERRSGLLGAGESPGDHRHVHEAGASAAEGGNGRVNLGKSDRPWGPRLRHLGSLDWLQGKSTGNYGFPVNVPLNQSNDRLVNITLITIVHPTCNELGFEVYEPTCNVWGPHIVLSGKRLHETGPGQVFSPPAR